MQERICREYAEKEGFEIVEVFIEKGESAKTTDRKELKRLLDTCTVKSGNIHAVIAYKVDRISRNIADYSFIRVRLKKYGVEIKSVTEFFEDTPAGRFMENIIANVSQFDNDVRTERSVGGMKEAALEGRYVWLAPLGYRNGKMNGKSNIIPNALAPLMKEVFELVATRFGSTNEIRLIMAKKGLVNKHGQPIPRAHFHRLLRNTLYKGIIKKFGKNYNGTFEPIVSTELFDDVQQILKGRMKKVKHYLHDNVDFPLRRFVTNEDGKQLTGYWSQGKRLKYPYYSFSLPNTTIRKEVLEQKFMGFLAQYTFDKDHLNVIREYLIKHFKQQSTNQQDNKEMIQKRIIEINAQIDNLIKLESKGSISSAILEDRVTKFDTELEELKRLLMQRENKEVSIPRLLTFAAEVLKEPYLLWQNASLAVRKKLQVFEFPQGVVFDGINFRTPKVCSIFKLKGLIDSYLLPRVDSKSSGKNTLIRRNFTEPYNLLDNKAFWENIISELVELETILSEKSPQVDVEE
jgi:site-specific DNA recombinase